WRPPFPKGPGSTTHGPGALLCSVPSAVSADDRGGRPCLPTTGSGVSAHTPCGGGLRAALTAPSPVQESGAARPHTPAGAGPRVPHPHPLRYRGPGTACCAFSCGHRALHRAPTTRGPLLGLVRSSEGTVPVWNMGGAASAWTPTCTCSPRRSPV